MHVHKAPDRSDIASTQTYAAWPARGDSVAEALALSRVGGLSIARTYLAGIHR
jgi:hypothetical protein